ncbi:MAG TPA: hypothetical protein VGI91_07515 [Steroidobacteraceae bacterium]
MTGAATRDYKARRARRLDAQRLHDFGAGAAVGIALTAAAFLVVGTSAHRVNSAAHAVHPQAQPPAAGATVSAPGPAFGEILTHPEVQMTRQEQVLAGTTAKAPRR